MRQRADGPRIITVVTPSRGDLGSLLNCCRSVDSQKHRPIEHLIILDGSVHHRNVTAALADLRSTDLDRRTSIGRRHGTPPWYLPARVAALRNLGVAEAKGDYIAFLDDDNLFEPEHLESLLNLLEADPSLDAAHSHRRLITTSGSPYVDRFFPWSQGDQANDIDRWLCSLGVREPGSPVMRDSLVSPDGSPLFLVDSSEWLIRRGVFERLKFREIYEVPEVLHHFTEDFLFAQDMVEIGLKVGCTMQATLSYRLGGYSNL